MLNLLEGIRVVDRGSTQFNKPRAWISPGTLKLHKLNFPEIPYDENAFVPLESWRELNYSEQRLLFDASSNGSLDKSTHIGIIHLSESTVAPLLDLGVAFAQTTEDCQLLSQHPDYQAAVTYLVEHLSSLCCAERHIVVHQVSVNAAGLPTVTYDQATQEFLGLHLDSWDKLPIEQRHLSTNRICINLGLEDRFLLFVNLTMMNMMHLVRIDSTVSQRSPASVRHAFLTQYPDYPVIKLRISPGEAYIAPTENMIHDGCTLGKQFFDVTLTIRGHIELPFSSLTQEDNHEHKAENLASI